MSQMPETYVRHPLGLPPGSVRAMLAVMITGLFVLLLALPADKPFEMPLFLYFLMSLLLVFVTAHGKTIETVSGQSPFGMPKGTFRFVIAALVIAVVAWRFWTDQAVLLKRLTPTEHQLGQWPYLCASLFGGFLVGRLLRMGPWRTKAMFQDMLAWVSLLCMIGLAIETLAILFIGPNVAGGLNMSMLEAILTTAIALYFGARS
ncbi:MAG: hypothetical protein ACJ8C4_12050 [Gemmataceae bacterium]